MNEAHAIQARDDGFIINRGASITPPVTMDPSWLIGGEAAEPMLRTRLCLLPRGEGNSWFYRDLVRVIDDPRIADRVRHRRNRERFRSPSGSAARGGARHSEGFTFPLGAEEQPTGAISIIAGVEVDNAAGEDGDFREQFELSETEATAHEIVHVIRLFAGAPWRDRDPEVARAMRLVRRLVDPEEERREGDLPLTADPNAGLRQQRP